MKLESVQRNISSSGMMEVATAKIAATAKLFDMFANDTYANKPLAIMRETVANGIDAHIAANTPDRPVEVTLPTELDPTCIIKDFGIGMSHEFVMGPFMEYTNGSTKDQDDSMIGGFGIGSKSPLSYVDAFTLRVVHDGVLSVYTLFKNEIGIPSIGLQAQTTTSEPNGVEISFPVEAADVTAFHEAAQEALQYFTPTPIVHNGTINPPEYAYRGNGWALRKTHGPLGVIVGGVRYPVTTANLDYALRTHAKLSPLLEYGLDLTMPIGSVGIAMSREQLSYVPKTSTAIQAALEGLVDDVVQTFSNLFDHCPSEWEAMKLLAEETGLNSYYGRSPRARLLLANARYKGQKLETNFRMAYIAGWKSATIQPRSNRRGVNTPPIKWEDTSSLYSVMPGAIEAIVIDDLPQTPKSKAVARMRYWLDKQKQAKTIIIVRPKEGVHRDRVLEVFKNPQNDVYYSSDMPEPPAKVRGVSTRPRVRMFTFDGSRDSWTRCVLTNLTPSASKPGVKEVEYANQPSSGIAVIMENFELPSGFTQKMETGLISYGELKFVNVSDWKKIKDSFEDFNDVFQARLDARMAQYPELPQRLAVYHAISKGRNTAIRDLNEIVSDPQFRKLPAAALKRPFGRLLTLFRDYVLDLNADQHALASFCNPKLPAGATPEELWQLVAEKQREVTILYNSLSMENAEHRKILFKLM